jgi:hypothetical protein
MKDWILGLAGIFSVLGIFMLYFFVLIAPALLAVAAIAIAVKYVLGG